MRITVGGVLVVAVGAFVGYTYLGGQSAPKNTREGRSLNDRLSSVRRLFQSGMKKPEVREVRPSPIPFPTHLLTDQQKAAATSAASTAAVSGTQVTMATAAAAANAAVNRPTRLVPDPVDKPRAVARPTPKPAVRQPTVNKIVTKRIRKKEPKGKITKEDGTGLVGTYVGLELTNGQVVRGVLQEKSATHYKMELPGLGPFTYPASRVKRVRPAD